MSNLTQAREWIKQKGEKILISSVFCSSIALAFLGGNLYSQDQKESPHLVITIPDYEKVAEEFKKADVQSQSEKTLPPGTEPVASVVSPTKGSAETSPTPDATECPYVGSKNSDKYHLATCGVVKRIKPTNIRCFKTPEIAEAAGYKPGCLK